MTTTTDQDQGVTVTMPCELDRHDRCRGRIISATAAHGEPCQCPCHEPATYAA